MKTLFVFNHPAPYKVHCFNQLVSLTDIQVIFEREKASDRPDTFYSQNEYKFPVRFLKYGGFSRENTFSGEVKKHIKQHHDEYKTIVMNGYSTIAEMKAIRYMIKHNIPYVLQINGGVIKKDSSFKKKLKNYFISHAYKYISPCEGADNYLIHYGARKEDIYRYPYGNYFDSEIIKKPLTKEEKAALREKYNLPNGTIFINASQFIERKNNIQLIEIFKTRREHLILVGSGKEKNEYEKIIKENNLTNIHIMDYKPKQELFEIMQACDCFITLSFEDIFGHTTLEAMANGLAVISSKKVVSSNDIIINGKNGYLVDIENSDSIIEAINNYSLLSSQSAIDVAKNNTVEKSAHRLYEILEEIK